MAQPGATNEYTTAYIFSWRKISIVFGWKKCFIWCYVNTCCGTHKSHYWGNSNEYPKDVLFCFFSKKVLMFSYFSIISCCRDSLEAPHWGASEYHKMCFCGDIRKIFTWYLLLSRIIMFFCFVFFFVFFFTEKVSNLELWTIFLVVFSLRTLDKHKIRCHRM